MLYLNKILQSHGLKSTQKIHVVFGVIAFGNNPVKIMDMPAVTNSSKKRTPCLIGQQSNPFYGTFEMSIPRSYQHFSDPLACLEPKYLTKQQLLKPTLIAHNNCTGSQTRTFFLFTHKLLLLQWFSTQGTSPTRETLL